jgi:hypothetical protein
MSNHLSEEQFAKCFLGQSTSGELDHIKECLECSAELDRFGNRISSFRSALRGRIDARIASQSSSSSSPWSTRPAIVGSGNWRWALVAATAVLVLIVTVPFLTTKKEPAQVVEKASTVMSPDALMDAVNLHVSRTVPAPMERMMALMPGEESVTELGGVQ